jgi:hypothetical protein
MIEIDFWDVPYKKEDMSYDLLLQDHRTAFDIPGMIAFL